MIAKLFDGIFVLHPVAAVVLAATLVGLVGCFEYFYENSRGAAYLTWAIAGGSLAVFLFLHLFGF